MQDRDLEAKLTEAIFLLSKELEGMSKQIDALPSHMVAAFAKAVKDEIRMLWWAFVALGLLQIFWKFAFGKGLL